MDTVAIAFVPGASVNEDGDTDDQATTSLSPPVAEGSAGTNAPLAMRAPPAYSRGVIGCAESFDTSMRRRTTVPGDTESTMYWLARGSLRASVGTSTNRIPRLPVACDAPAAGARAPAAMATI